MRRTHARSIPSARVTILMPVLLAPVVLAQAAGADPVFVDNHSFEADFAAPNTFPTGPVAGWDAIGIVALLNSGGNAIGVINPTGSTFFPAGAPEGDNAALIFLSQNIGQGPVGLFQETSEPLTAGATYTLTVDVGNIDSGIGSPPFDTFGFYDLTGFPGYSVQLTANGVVLAEDYNTLASTIPEGEFVTTTIEYTAPQDFPLLGFPVQIAIYNLNQPDPNGHPGIEVDFDNVRLDATPPCPADTNDDGVLDNGDISEFVSLYLAGNVAADFNNDGIIDNGDIGTFIMLFLAGC